MRTVVEEPARRGQVVGLALASLDDASTAWYLPIGHAEGSVADDVAAPLVALLSDPSVALTVYDLKRDLLAWRARGVTVTGCDVDLLLCAYLVNTRARVPPVPVLAEDLCGVRMEDEATLVGSGRAARRITDCGVRA